MGAGLDAHRDPVGLPGSTCFNGVIGEVRSEALATRRRVAP